MNRTHRLHARQLSTFRFLATIFILTYGVPCSGQSCLKRTYDYPGSLDTIIHTTDGNFVTFGTFLTENPDGNYTASIILKKIRPDGDTMWSKQLQMKNSIEFYSAILLPGDEFITVASIDSHHDGISELLFLKLTANGDTILTRTYGDDILLFGTKGLYGLSLADGTFLFGTNRMLNDSVRSSCWLLNININCDTIWTKASSFFSYDFLLDKMVQAIDGTILMGGRLMEHDAVQIIKLSSGGRIIWNQQIHFPCASIVLKPMSDGGALLSLDNYLQNPDSGNVTVFRIETDGTPAWNRSIGAGGYDFLNDISIQADGIFFLGTNYSTDYNTFIAKFSIDGTILWKKIYKYTQPETGLFQSTDGGTLTVIRSFDSHAMWKFNSCGDTLWSVPLGNGSGYPIFASFTDAGTGTMLRHYFNNPYGATSHVIRTLIDDRSASKNTLFTFKIPSLGPDTTSIGIAALKTPAGMTVSAGGTISWTPTSDSSYLEHVAFVVVNDLGRKDTVSFNITVNPVACASSAISLVPAGSTTPARRAPSLAATVLNGSVRFLLPAAAGKIDIYDMAGRRTGRVTPVATGSTAAAVWPGVSGKKAAPGKYVAKTTVGGKMLAKPFLLR